MPIICQFFGINIYMYFRDHLNAHFHAKYGGEEITMEIENGKVIGKMNKRAISLINEWRLLHIDELRNDWKLAMEKFALKEIQPLE